MYVLPWGQMSFWGATVITSLATVIPVVGKTVLSYLWGGLKKASLNLKVKNVRCIKNIKYMSIYTLIIFRINNFVKLISLAHCEYTNYIARDLAGIFYLKSKILNKKSYVFSKKKHCSVASVAACDLCSGRYKKTSNSYDVILRYIKKSLQRFFNISTIFKNLRFLNIYEIFQIRILRIRIVKISYLINETRSWNGAAVSATFLTKVNKTLFDAGTGFFKNLKYVCNYFMNNLLFQNKVKILHMISKSAGLFKPYSFKKGATYGGGNCLNNNKTNKPLNNNKTNKPLNNSQRPNARDLQWLVGFVEGNGSFTIKKNGKYVKYEFAIEIHISDIKLLYKIKTILGGFGSIITYLGNKTELASLKITSKNDLKRVIVPIFDKYSMLTSKQYEYLFFRSCILQNITYFEHLPTYIQPVNTPFCTIQDILNVYYFDTWLVGFIEAVASFSIYPVVRPFSKGKRRALKGDLDEASSKNLWMPSTTKELNKTAKFELSITNGLQIITAIKERLNLTSNPYVDKNNSCRIQTTNPYVDKNNSCRIQTTNKRGIQNIINFLKKTPVKLKGNKRAQYLKLLHELRVNSRYRDLNIPDHF